METNDLLVVALDDEAACRKQGRYCFNLERDGVKLLRMFAEDSMDRKLWVDALERCICELGMSGNPMV